MNPKITDLDQILLIGMRIETNLSENKTYELWKKFMQNRNQIKNRKDDNYYSVQIYPEGITMDTFTPITNFQKWAAVSVSNIDYIPNCMECLIIDSGKYAVFKHKGKASDFFGTSQEIFGTWLPNSSFKLANRPHFEIMKSDYNGPEDPNSEEDVYIPILE